MIYNEEVSLEDKQKKVREKTARYVRITSKDVQEVVDSLTDEERVNNNETPGTPTLKMKKLILY